MPKQDKVMEKLDQIGTEVSTLGRELATNTTETKNIVARLDKLNGSISNHESRLQGIERTSDLTAQTLSMLQKQVSTEEQDAKVRQQVTQDRTWVWIDRILVGLLSAIVVLILTHADFVKQLF